MSRAELRKLTASLVRIPSHEDETAAGELIADWLHEHTDARVEIFPICYENYLL